MKLTPEEEQARVEAIFMRRSKILQAIDFEIEDLSKEEAEQRAVADGLRKALATVEAKFVAAEDKLESIFTEKEAFEEARMLISDYATEP